MNTFRTSAPGKLILIGEHAVVYGKPAIIGAIDKRCFVTISEREDKKIKIISKNFNKEIITDFDETISKFNKAQDEWNKFYQNNDVEILKSITSGALDYPQIIIGQFLEYFKLISINGFDLKIDSELPVGAGMGSSAALAVSIIGALFLFTNKKFDKEDINKIAFLCEQKKHGRPSGGDNSASCFGGLILFKKDEGVRQLDLNIPTEIKENFYVINTGVPEESTGKMVSIVKDLYRVKSNFVVEIFIEQAELTEQFLVAIQNVNKDEVMRIIKAGEKNLEKIGAVSESTKDLIRKIEENGGCAKVCGAGGRADKSGIILIYHENLQKLMSILKPHGFKTENLEFDYQGLKTEH